MVSADFVVSHQLEARRNRVTKLPSFLVRATYIWSSHSSTNRRTVMASKPSKTITSLSNQRD